MIFEQENKNNITFINETTTFRHTIYFEKTGLGNERHLNFHFVLKHNETDHNLFVLDSDDIKYSFLNSLDEVWLNRICYYDENSFIKKFYTDTYFMYNEILKVFRCFLCDKNKVLFNKKNFLDDLNKELKLHFFESYKK